MAAPADTWTNQSRTNGPPEHSHQNYPSAPRLPGIPPGLEHLAQVNHVLIHQKRSNLLQVSRKYEILDPRGQVMFFAKDERAVFGPWMDVKIFDHSSREILHLYLHTRIFNNELEVFCPPGSLLGTIAKEVHLFKTRLAIMNLSKETVLKAVGPSFGKHSFGDVVFEVKTSGGSQVVGSITRVWRGIGKEMFSTNDHYSLHFPVQLDTKIKALLMATGLFIDYLIYEKK